MSGGLYTEDEVAEILEEQYYDACACNYNSNDEWLPFVCQYTNTECPNPKEKNGCWKEWLRHRKEREK